MTESPGSVAAPIDQSERIVLLDSLRGIAVLGILLMNIPGFGIAHSAIFDFSLMEGGQANYFAWYVFGPGVFEGSMRAIFSMLFGASSIIFITRLEKRIPGIMPAELFIRRQLWLLVFGLFNAFILLWFWDILYHYAICGIIIFAFRRLKPLHLVLCALVCLFLITARENSDLGKQKAVIRKGEAISRIDTAKTPLTMKQKMDLGRWEEMKDRSDPVKKKEKMQQELEQIRGSYADIYDARSKMSAEGETKAMYYFLIWDVLLFMFLGMAFFKLGVLQGEIKTKWYVLMALVGLGIGLPLSWLFMHEEVRLNWNWYEVTRQRKFAFYEIQRLVHSIGIFGLIMLIYKSGLFKWLFKLMRPVGQMAFTNYLMQSLICGIFFYGVGFGMFGKLQRYELYYVVGAVWILEIIWSHIWLRYFRFGPLEWLWRSLTYWKRQPLKRNSQ